MCGPAARNVDPRIRLNTVGFLPDSPKCASIAAPAGRFAVCRSPDDRRVFEADTSQPIVNADTEETLVVADFSAVTEPGDYYLQMADVGTSASFRIGGDVYLFAYYTAMRAMYQWRCGTAVSATHNGQTFSHGPCHMHDAYLDFVGGGHVKRDCTGGWHDAGDYNKYVVNTGFTVGVLFQAWEHFADNIKNITLDIPESGGALPDFLAELRWEMQWLLKMQDEAGRAYHKLSTTKFCGSIMPEAEDQPRFFVPWGTAATADMAASMAMAARIFQPYDGEFARQCLAAANKSYAFLAAHPEEHRADQTGFSTGGYQVADAHRRLWAAAEMWQTTGEPACLADFGNRARGLDEKVDLACSWGHVKNLGIYTYLFSNRPGRDPVLVDELRRALLTAADRIVQTRNVHGYARPLGEKYFWGCTGDVAQQVQTLHLANRISPKRDYLDTALDALGHLFGRNFFGRSFVTGVGHNPPLHPHDRRSIADHIADPWPGYLVGGGWPAATDWVDDEKNFRVNEIAINWNATLIYALACFINGQRQPAAAGRKA